MSSCSRIGLKCGGAVTRNGRTTTIGPGGRTTPMGRVARGCTTLMGSVTRGRVATMETFHPWLTRSIVCPRRVDQHRVPCLGDRHAVAGPRMPGRRSRRGITCGPSLWDRLVALLTRLPRAWVEPALPLLLRARTWARWANGNKPRRSRPLRFGVGGSTSGPPSRGRSCSQPWSPLTLSRVGSLRVGTTENSADGRYEDRPNRHCPESENRISRGRKNRVRGLHNERTFAQRRQHV